MHCNHGRETNKQWEKFKTKTNTEVDFQLPKPMIRGMAQNKHVMFSAETLMNSSAFICYFWILQPKKLRNADGFVNVLGGNHDVFWGAMPRIIGFGNILPGCIGTSFVSLWSCCIPIGRQESGTAGAVKRIICL